MNARRTSAAALVATVAACVAVGVATPSYAKGGDAVRSSKACSTGTLNLKAKAESGNRLELEAEVDSNMAGQEWTVTLTNDGKTVWTGKRITAGPSGSLSVETTVAADGEDTTPAPSPTTTTPTTPTTTPTTSTTTTAPTSSSTSDTSSTTTSDDSSSTTTADPTTTTDDSGHDKGDDHPGLRAASSKGGDDKPGDDKGGQSKPATGKHVIGVTATLDALTCATDVTL
jgi:hypothetical protein